MQLNIAQSDFKKVSDIKIPEIFYKRLKTGVREFDAMFGEGILPGSAATVTAPAGCGKTTFLLQLLDALAKAGYKTGYTSGEESLEQLAYTCKRLNVTHVDVANITNVDALAAAMSHFDVLVVDSFQALTTTDKLNFAERERYAVSTLIQTAKKTECAVFFVMHLTKAGVLKGSTLIPHSVDVNIQISLDKDNGDDFARIISFYKNRFGPTLEYTAELTGHGFELSSCKKAPAPVTKKDKQRTLYKQILELDPPGITKQRLMNEIGLTSSQAYLALKELTDAGKIVKYGRGEAAIWKKTL